MAMSFKVKTERRLKEVLKAVGRLNWALQEGLDRRMKRNMLQAENIAKENA